jgi:hypothetical protein
MDLVDRVQGIILKPKEEWEKIKGESLTVTELFTSYAMILVAIPAVAQLIGFGIVGFKVPFVGWYRLGLGAALARAIVAYILTLGAVFLLGFIINALAPSFASKQSQDNAMKLAVFSMTPTWLAGVLYIIPALTPLALLASLYGIYILYLGMTAGIMETPKEKVVSYLVVVIIVSFILVLFVSFILSAIFAVGVGMGAV